MTTSPPLHPHAAFESRTRSRIVAGVRPAPLWLFIPTLLAFATLSPEGLQGASPGSALLDRWLAQREAANTFCGEFHQVTQLRSFKRAIGRTGTLYATRDGLVRCDLRKLDGVLATTILSTREEVIVIREDRGEYQARRIDDAPDRAFGFGVFPALGRRDEFLRRFTIVSTGNDGRTVVLEPSGEPLKGRLKTMTMGFDPQSARLERFELILADGSSVATEITAAEYGAALDLKTFYRDLTILKRNSARGPGL